MKKLILTLFVALSLIACGDSAWEKTLKEARENAYIDSSNGNSITDIEPTGDIPADDISDLEGYDFDKKIGYEVKYMLNGKKPLCRLNVYAYNKNNMIIAFIYDTTCVFDEVFMKHCTVEVKENTMIAVKGIIDSEECNNKEGEAYNKILNAINHETYFDY